ncbi:hypothetical protein J8281_18500 [Aquimarina sp. U1-2]|uniref:hypothetical protein n=1 Tax=Aquimarina sp. U1-2 TaxID=2823141 RepID=UPI001AECCE4B|nr:hypothetical protein [Aquimarina sp. U1-2]MBP2834195.1 hypothetical protein [Aquimarina sp. U1-2]
MSHPPTLDNQNKKRNYTRNYLIITTLIFGLLIIPSLLVIMMSVMMFDSSGSQDSLPTLLLFISFLVYPFITGISLIVAWILFVKKRNLGTIVFASLPLLNIMVSCIAICYIMIVCDGAFDC